MKKKNSVAVKQRKLSPGLSHRHHAFIINYVMHWNAARAAREAGYSKRSAGQIGHELLKRHDIATEISSRRHAMAEDIDRITKERVQYELASVGLANAGDFAPMFGDGDVSEKLGNLTRTQAAAVKEVVVEEFRDRRSDWRTVRRTKFKLHDKHAALELLAKMQGWVRDKVDIEHKHQGLILHSILNDIAAAEADKPIVAAGEG
jgi:phage terminase small subunit